MHTQLIVLAQLSILKDYIKLLYENKREAALIKTQ
jgi:hypothetical protein